MRNLISYVLSNSVRTINALDRTIRQNRKHAAVALALGLSVLLAAQQPALAVDLPEEITFTNYLDIAAIGADLAVFGAGVMFVIYGIGGSFRIAKGAVRGLFRWMGF